MIGVAGHFAAVLHRSHQLDGQHLRADAEHEVGFRELMPEFRLDQRRWAAPAPLEMRAERLDYQEVRADVRGVEVLGVRGEYPVGLQPVENLAQGLDLSGPPVRTLAPLFQVHAVKPGRVQGHDEAEPERPASRFELPQAPRPLAQIAAQGDSDVRHLSPCFQAETKGQRAAQ